MDFVDLQRPICLPTSSSLCRALRRIGRGDQRLNAFANAGGHLLYTFKTGSRRECEGALHYTAGSIAEAAAVQYNQFTIPEASARERSVPRRRRQRRPPVDGTADTDDRDHRRALPPCGRGKYAAVVRNNYGKGEVTYVGFMPGDALAEKSLRSASSGWSGGAQQALHFPTIMRSGVLSDGHPLRYPLNYWPLQPR